MIGTETITTFSQETFQGVINEVKPLLSDHWEEVAYYKDIKLAPDYDLYEEIERKGMLRVFVMRVEGELVGYAAYFIKEHIHYKNTVMAAQDVVFIAKEHRGGSGYKFIKWCDEQLKADGVHIVTQHVKAAHNFGKMLERMDYELMDLIYVRRLI